MEFKLEREMRAPMIKWLLNRGFVTAVEFWLCYNPADLVGGRYGRRPAPRRIPPLLETIAIELKLLDVAGVIEQAKRNAGKCDWSWCAMPDERVAKMRQGTIDKFSMAAVGLLSVGDSVREVVCPRKGMGLRSQAETKQLWRRVRSSYATYEVGACS